MPQNPGWTASDLPALAGRTIIVTGANSGIGFEAALQLAGKGARVVLACRDPNKTEAAATAIRDAHPGAALEAMPLDLASLASVRSFADAYRKSFTCCATTRASWLCPIAGPPTASRCSSGPTTSATSR
jgi:NAD(P)-dependent dehydrogenase (short-subunit alcohol dehydrogenase family)